MERIEIGTRESTELIDITGKVKEIVKSKNGGIDSGICVVFTKHTTSGIIINENESGLKSDILALLNGLIPEGKGYLHDRIDDNAHAHLRAVVLGSSVTIPIEKGDLALGTWQSIFFVECDGPRRREVYVKVIIG
ncbi:MAG: secondary thiamine-phosphate synthase enzyme YjbQ [Methanophagales archaeon]|nr:secondary thiamine-phosphate synthase enzyme YjbQ [Methanophagales archaeon]MCW3141797.1 secondary thiamine-phosphate synthase enzyme YjbQ [Methanophagales archaeon]